MIDWGVVDAGPKYLAAIVFLELIVSRCIFYMTANTLPVKFALLLFPSFVIISFVPLFFWLKSQLCTAAACCGYIFPIACMRFNRGAKILPDIALPYKNQFIHSSKTYFCI